MTHQFLVTQLTHDSLPSDLYTGYMVDQFLHISVYWKLMQKYSALVAFVSNLFTKSCRYVICHFTRSIGLIRLWRLTLYHGFAFWAKIDLGRLVSNACTSCGSRSGLAPRVGNNCYDCFEFSFSEWMNTWLFSHLHLYSSSQQRDNWRSTGQRMSS